MHGEKKWSCTRCVAGTGRKVVTTKQARIKQAPRILLLQLSRFQFSTAGVHAQKNRTHVEFPEERFLLPVFGQASGEGWGPKTDVPYQLKAAVVHGNSSCNSAQGTLTGGHYWAYVRRGASWIKAEDANVSPATTAELKKECVYLLVYEKTSNEDGPGVRTRGPRAQRGRT